MSSVTYTPVQNDIRYDISVHTTKVNDFTIYGLVVMDLAIGKKYELAFRFSEVKRLHASLLRKSKMIKNQLPELPKTHSFGLWNRTNNDHRKIEERRRQLQYYFDKLLNSPTLRGLPYIKTLLVNSTKAINRTQSTLPFNLESQTKKRANSLPFFGQRTEISI